MKWKILFFAALAITLLPTLASADGIIIIDPPPHPDEQVIPMEVIYHRVKINITKGVAVTHIDEVFHNPNDMDLEGTFIFPLLVGASISEFSLYIDGKKVNGEVLPADEARDIYEDIVRKLKDPALLEYMDRNLFKLRVYPIPARGERRIELTYTETLKYDFGTVKYVYPLDTEKYSSAPLDEVTIDASIKTDIPIKSVYSPSHEVDIARKGEKEVRLSYEEKNILPDKDFVLYYTLSKEEIDASLITYRERGDDGFFMLLLTPNPEVDPNDVIPKDVTFVLDTSGSMKGDKIRQAQDALIFCIKSLNEGDRFNIIRFATDTESFKKGLISANKKIKGEAQDFVNDIKAMGGTNINDALLLALKSNGGSKRPHMVIFITDGEPTVGETDLPNIIDNVKRGNKDKARIFVFGVGEEINTHLLDKISSENHGVSEYVKPSERIDNTVSNFIKKIQSPVLSNISIDMTKIKVKDVFPKEPPDLFAGSQVTIVGRYNGSGKSTILLTGFVNKKKVAFEYPVNFPDRDTESDFLPRIWATRKIAYLLDEIRLNGENRELVDEIIRLATDFGIVTPYTSFLVLEDQREGFGGAPAPGADEELDVMSEPSMLTKKSGSFGVKSAEKMRDLKETDKVKTSHLMSIKQVGERTFFLREKVWVDSEYKKGTKTNEIKYGSKKYWEFVRNNPKAGRYLSLGKMIIFNYEANWYSIN
ncbi:MAG: VWA domain-containing protein [Deltaproteobacteria bacterium]|uniref:VWA domain-containing protein n=1 Tax=Candidatus Zymogenus saltonus TaxID=2844893 RepID=A0A9D8K9U0_9DELT|nr:VWA domain-containing protein [Candidatus Zymogenus saltonus]